MRISDPSELEPLARLARLLGAGVSLIDRHMKIFWSTPDSEGHRPEPGGAHCYASKWGRSERCLDCIPLLVFRTRQARSGWRERARPGAPGETYWVHAVPVHDASGELRWVLEMALPIGLPGQSPSSGGDSQMGRLASAAGSAFLVVDASHRIVSWNPAATATFGYDIDEALGRRIDLLLPPEYSHEKAMIADLIAKHGEVTRMRTERLAKDGRRIPVLLSATALRDEAGELLGRSTVYEDLSAMEQLRRRLQTQNQLLAHINREAADGIIGFDLDGRVTSWNRGAQQTFGCDAEDMLGSHPDGILPRERLSELMQRVLAEGTVRGLHMTWSDSTGRSIPVEVTATLLHSGEEQPQGVAAVVRDMSARQRLARQMIRSEKLATVGSLAAGLAHEIGTPLNVISATVEYMLLDMDEGDPRRADLCSIVAETERIGKLVGELLTFARGTPTPREPVDVNQAAERVFRLIRVPAERKGVLLRHHVAPELPPVLAVPDELHQLLLNLLLNAVDVVSPQGHVVLDAQPAHEAPDQDLVVLRVHDDGPGVDPEVAERIFDPFFTTRADGTGLGLAVCSRIVAAHGGDIRVSEGPMGGACFSVLLPGKRDD